MKYYYGIIYLKNGDACICSACSSEEEVREALGQAIAKRVDSLGKILATSYMTREVEEGAPAPTLMDVLGHPRSRDLMQDKKFMNSL